MEYNSEIARNNLKFLRKSYGLTQAELSKNLDFAQNGISQYETGARPLGYEVAGMFANYFEVPFEMFGNKNLSEIMIINSSIDVKDVLEVVDIIFPVFDSNKAKEDKYFKRGFDVLSTIIKKAKAEIITGEIGKNWNREVVENNREATKEKMDNCVSDFINSYNSFHTLESIANLVGVMILVYAPLFDKEILEKGEVMLTKRKIDSKYLLSKQKENNSEKVKFIEEFDECITDGIKILKKYRKGSELGDYYLAIRYIFNVVNNEYEKDINNMIGEEMLNALVELENKYAIAFLKKRYELAGEGSITDCD